jgi:hypothetical protein
MGTQQPQSSKDLTVIITAILGTIGTVTVAYFAFRGNIAPVELAISATQTAESRLTQVALSAVQPTSTDVPIPTPTLTNDTTSLQPPIAPTASPSPTNTVVSSSTAPGYACATVNEQPLENSKLKRGQRFKVSFTIVNTGATVWPEDLVLDISSNPYDTVDASELPIKVPRVQPGDSINVGPFDAQAPAKDGHYVVDFELGDGFCWPYIAFDVGK